MKTVSSPYSVCMNLNTCSVSLTLKTYHFLAAEQVRGVMTDRWERMTYSQLVAECVHLKIIASSTGNGSITYFHNRLTAWLNKKLLRTIDEVEGLKRLCDISEEG